VNALTLSLKSSMFVVVPKKVPELLVKSDVGSAAIGLGSGDFAVISCWYDVLSSKRTGDRCAHTLGVTTEA
jgi:hypothetical protein